MSGKAQIPSLNGLRAISILMVIGGHLMLWNTGPAALAYLPGFFDGALGVRVFFVISGFLISQLLMDEGDKADLPAFYLRRVLRLVPVQVAFLIVLFVLTRTTPLKVSACQFVTAATYTKNYLCSSWVDGHLWSLAVEEQFYLVWPILLTRLPRRWSVTIATALILVSPISRAVEYHLGSRSFSWLTSHTDALMIGCLLAIGSRSRLGQIEAVVGWRPWAARLLAVAAAMVPALLSRRLMLAVFTVTLGPLIQAACVAYLIASFVYGPKGLSFRLLNSAVMNWVGILSYSLYIWQQLLVAPPSVYGLASSPLLAFPQNLALIFVVAAASYYGLERPLLGLRRRLHPRLGRRAQQKGGPEIQPASQS